MIRDPDVVYQDEPALTVDEFVAVRTASTLSERRPVSDRTCSEGMLAHADLTVTARIGTRFVGVSRSVTDFHYCCYLSDLAVDAQFQKRGIGAGLVRETRARLKPTCRRLLLSAPDAVAYYPKIGFERHPQAWTISPAGR